MVRLGVSPSGGRTAAGSGVMAGRNVTSAFLGGGETERNAIALAAAGVGEFEWNMTRGALWVSPRLAAVTGWPAGATSAPYGPLPLDRIHPADRSMLSDAVGRLLENRERLQIRIRILRSGDRAEQWVDVNAVAVSDNRGRPGRIVGVLRDVSAEKAEADQLRTLVGELDHRVKNVLAAVQSLAAQSARRTISLDAFLKTFFGRLQAMAAAHTLLTATRWRGVEISHVAAAELGGLAHGQARWSGPDIVLNPRATHALTLALHELGANAVKYGALSTEAGRIDVRWRTLDNGGFELEWIESGGPIVSPPTHRGFGSTLLERVTGRELGGAALLDFRPEGLHVRITADGSALAPQTPAEAPQAALDTTPAPQPSTPEAPPNASRGGPGDPDIRGVRVLIVEDSVLLALELEAGLVECGATVVGTAADLDEALGMAGFDFDVAILDADLNGRSVTPVACELTTRRTPFILATGYGEGASAPAGFDVPVVRKPFNVRQVAAALAEALGRAKAGARVLPA